MTKQSTGKGNSSRHGARLLERRMLAFNRWKDGESQTAIAKSLKLSKQTIWLDIQICLRHWREEHRGSVNEHVEMELARLNRLEVFAEQKLELVKETSMDGVEWVKTLLDIGKERRKLLGLDAPSRTEIKSDITVSRTFKTKEEMYAEVRKGLERFRERLTSQN